VLPDLLTRALTRRWRLAVVTLLSGLFVTVLLRPAWGVHEYEATHVLYSPAAARAAAGGALTDPFLLKPDAIAALATSRQTAGAAAARLGFDGSPLKLVEHLKTKADAKAGTISITDRRTNPANAVAVADAIAQALVGLVDDSRASARARAIDEAETRVDTLQHDLSAIDARDPATKPRRDQLTQELNSEAAKVDELRNAGATSGISTIRPAVAHRVSSGSLRSLPPVAGWLLTLLPLLALGLGVAVAAELADDTIADEAEADVATGLPLLAAVPRHDEEPANLTTAPPEPVARAIGQLRRAVIDAVELGRAGAPSFAVPSVRGDGRVVLITSPGAEEGTTDTVVHFASAVAETGRSALIVDCDDDAAADDDGHGERAGLGDLAAEGIVPQSLRTVMQATSLPRVSLVPRGSSDGVASWLVRHGDLVDRARGLADVVILHGPGLLSSNATAELAKLADDTVVVCRSGATRSADARRAADRLRAAQVDAGVVLVDAPPVGAPIPDAAELVRRLRADPKTRGRLEWAGAGVVMLLLFVLLRSFVFESFSIPTPSMVPYLEPGDRVLVSRLSYRLHAVHRGDVIVFDAPRNATALQGERLIKRVIALPGETVESKDGHILINGKQLAEKYLPKTTVTEGVKRLKLPRGRYWVMGDNRANSADSRFFGSISRGSIIGRAFFHIWPWPVGFM
jgi:signal peptidase I